MFPSPRSAAGLTHLDSPHTQQRSLPGLPSFEQFTEGLWGYRRTDITATATQPPILPSPFTSPAASVDSPNFPPVLHRRPSQDSQQAAPVPGPIALFPPPPPVRYALPPTTAAPSVGDVRHPSHEDVRPTKSGDDLTKIPLGWSYKEALDAVSLPVPSHPHPPFPSTS